MALYPDQKFSTFADGGDLQTNDIVVGLRGGINTKFNWTISGAESITGTVNQIFANGTYGTPVTGPITLTLPQNVNTTAAFQVNTLQLNSSNGLLDQNGKIILGVIASASPVNYLTLSNSGTGGGPTLSAVGTDGNISLNINAKGTGQVNLTSTSVSPVLINSGTGSQKHTYFTFANTSGTNNVTFPDVSGTTCLLNASAHAVSNGFVPIGDGTTFSSAALTAGTGISITNGAGSITIAAASAVAISFATDSGTATPAAGVLTISGSSTGLTTSGSGSTVGLTGTLKLGNGGTNNALTASNGGIVWSDASKLNILAGTATANLPLLSGSTATPSWGSFALSLGGALTTAGAHTLSGAFASTFTFTNTTNVTFPTSGTLATTAGTVASITGTTNQIIASASTGAVTLSAPQNLNTTAAFQVNTLQLNSSNGLLDSAGNILLSYSGGGNYNYIQVKNNSTGYPPSFTAAGNDPNVSMWLYGKGTGIIVVSTAALTTPFAIINGTGSQHTTNFVFANTSAAQNVTFPDASFTIAGTTLALNGTGASLTASNGGIVYSTASAMAILSGTATAQQLLLSGASTTPQWSTTTYPLTNAINTIMYASSANVLGVITPVNSAVLISSSGGVPSMSTTLPSGISATNMNLTTPRIASGGLTSVTGYNWIGVTETASAVNYINVTNNSTGNSPSITFTGSDPNVIGQISAKGTGGVAIQGTSASTPANAPSGYVGELLSGTNATAVAMTSTTPAQINTLSLTAGDWDVWAVFYTTVGGTTTQSAVFAWIDTVSASLSARTTAQLSAINGTYGTLTTGQASYINTGVCRWNVGTSTTVYLNAVATYGTSTLTGNGNIFARRVR